MIIIKTGIAFLNFIYYFIKKSAVNNQKILFLSRQSNEISTDFKKLNDALCKKYQTVIICKKLSFSFIGLISGFFLLFKQMYHIATSKVIIVDGYSIPISILNHRKGNIIIQMWHADVIIKKIGLQTKKMGSKRKQKLIETMKMHQNYDYAIASSEHSARIFREAFNIPIDKVKVLGTPTLDYLYYKEYNKEQLLKEKYREAKRKNILYMPTYRKNAEIDLSEISKHIDFSKYKLIIKFHPIQKHAKINLPVEIAIEKSEDLLSIADYTITDYSNVAFQSMLMNIPTFFYIYDYEDYVQKYGNNIDIQDKNLFKSNKKIEDILKQIENDDLEMIKQEKAIKEFLPTFDGQCTKRIIEFIDKKMEGKV